MQGLPWFVRVAESLGISLGNSRYVPHPGCTTSDKAWVYHTAKGIGFYCNKCGADGFRYHAQRTMREYLHLRELEKTLERAERRTVVLPAGCVPTLPPEGVVWLAKAGIPAHQARELGFCWHPTYERVFIPVYNSRGVLVYYQARAVDGREPKYINPRVDKSSVLYPAGLGRTGWDFSRPIVANEDILSAVRCGAYSQAVGLLGTKLSSLQEAFLGRFSTVILWLDGDRAGQRGRSKIRKALKWYTRVVPIETPLDPKYYADAQIKEILHGANQYNGTGVYHPRLYEM